MSNNKIYELCNEDFEKLIRCSHNIKEVLFKLGMTTVGNSWGYAQVKKRMRELNVDYSAFIGVKPLIKSQFKRLEDKEIFICNSDTPRNIIRRRIIENDLLEYKCSCCGISEWLDQPISLELDHINGINNDHRLENLRFLCPNCHSQTSTYGSKNSSNRNKFQGYSITDEQRLEILKVYQETSNIRKTANITKYPVKVVRHIVNVCGVKRSNQKYVIRYSLDGQELGRWGTITELAQFLLDNKEIKATKLKGARECIYRNIYKEQWLNSIWKVIVT